MSQQLTLILALNHRKVLFFLSSL